MQDDRDERYYRVRIIRMKSGNGINSGKLKMPEGSERGKEKVGDNSSVHLYQDKLLRVGRHICN